MSKTQIKEICDLVRVDMAAYLGYVPLIREISEAVGDDCRFQIGELLPEHYTKEIQDYFSERLWARVREVMHLYGEDGVQELPSRN